MNTRSVVLWGFALVAAPLVSACATKTNDASSPVESSDGAAPDGATSGGSDDAGGATSSGDSSTGSSSNGDSDSSAPEKDSGHAQEDSGSADAAGPGHGGQCIRPPYQTTNECTGIGKTGGPVIPSCSNFDANGKLVCPSIPGCTVVPDPTGTYCMGDNVTCGLSDCGHICLLPDWDPCYDVASGKCLEGC